MKITPELLKRYTSGQCTEEERRLVENWLPGKEDMTADLSEEEVTAETEWMWRIISKDIAGPKTVPLYKKLTRYAAVACVAFLVFISSFLGVNKVDSFEQLAVLVNCSPPFQKNIAHLVNNSDKPQTYKVGGLLCTLLPSQQSNVAFALCGIKSDVTFCGDMILENKTGRDVKLEVASMCKLSKYTTKEIVLKKGHNYVLTHRKYQVDEIHITDIARLGVKTDHLTRKFGSKLREALRKSQA